MSVQESSTRTPWSHSKGQAPHPVRWCRSLALILVMLPLASFAGTPAQEGKEPGSLMDAYRELNQEQEPSARANLNCHPNPLAFRSRANHHYVSAEVGFDPRDERYGKLRARSLVAGPWERFYLCREYGTGAVVLRSEANKLYVAAELGFHPRDQRYGTLRARTPEDKIGDWERFYFVHLGHNDFLLKSFIRDGPYVTTEVLWPGERYGTLRTRTREPGRREVFY